MKTYSVFPHVMCQFPRPALTKYCTQAVLGSGVSWAVPSVIPGACAPVLVAAGRPGLVDASLQSGSIFTPCPPSLGHQSLDESPAQSTGTSS